MKSKIFVLRNQIEGLVDSYRSEHKIPDTCRARRCLDDLNSTIESLPDRVDLEELHDWLAEYIYGLIPRGAEVSRHEEAPRPPKGGDEAPRPPKGGDGNAGDTQVMLLSEEAALLMAYFSELDFALWEEFERGYPPAPQGMDQEVSG